MTPSVHRKKERYVILEEPPKREVEHGDYIQEVLNEALRVYRDEQSRYQPNEGELIEPTSFQLGFKARPPYGNEEVIDALDFGERLLRNACTRDIVLPRRTQYAPGEILRIEDPRIQTAALYNVVGRTMGNFHYAKRVFEKITDQERFSDLKYTIEGLNDFYDLSIRTLTA